jgi:hypothetical protein
MAKNGAASDKAHASAALISVLDVSLFRLARFDRLLITAVQAELTILLHPWCITKLAVQPEFNLVDAE